MTQFIYGKNSFLLNKRLKQLEADFSKIDTAGINLEKIDGADLTYSKLEQALSAMPFLADKRMVIIRNLLSDNKDAELKNKIADLLEPLLKTKREGATDLIIVENGESDKRTKLYKMLQKHADIFEARTLEGRELVRFICDTFQRDGVEITPTDADYLAQEAGNDMQKLEGEVKKIALYVRSQKRAILERNDIDLLVSAEINPNVFAFTEAISRKDARTASRLLNELLINGENEQKLLGSIAFQFRTLLIIKDALERGVSSSEIASKGKIAPFVVTKNIAIARNKTMRSLILMYDNLRRMDALIKSSAIAPDLAINILVTTLCR